jgi:translation initiation factor 5B
VAVVGPGKRYWLFRAGVMLEKAKEFAVMLCFDDKVDKEANLYADEIGVKIFEADIIYHLFDKFTAHGVSYAVVNKVEDRWDIEGIECYKVEKD